MAKKAPQKKMDPNFGKVVAVFSKHKDVTPPEDGNKFGSGGLKVKGKIFAMMSSKDEFVVKLSKERVAELSASSKGKPFTLGPGRVMKEWLVVQTAPKSWVSLALEAYEFVKKSK